MIFFRCHKVLVAAQMLMLVLQILIRQFFMSTLVWVSTIARPVKVGRSASIGECCVINPAFIGLRKHLVTCQLVFLCDFYWSASIGKPRMTPVSLANSTESHAVSLVTINRQTSYEYGILCQDYEIIRVLPRCRFPNTYRYGRA